MVTHSHTGLHPVTYGHTPSPTSLAQVVHERTYTVCGTPDYIAPEIIGNHGHDIAADWWALGCLIFEMLTGQAPFSPAEFDIPKTTAADGYTTTTDQAKLQEMIFHSVVERRLRFPWWMAMGRHRDLINELLTVDPHERLGVRAVQPEGFQEVMDHRWFGRHDRNMPAVDWLLLESHSVVAPFIPKIANNMDTSNFHKYKPQEEVPAVDWDALQERRVDAERVAAAEKIFLVRRPALTLHDLWLTAPPCARAVRACCYSIPQLTRSRHALAGLRPRERARDGHPR